MSALDRAIWILKLPFRVAWGALLIANFLAFAPLFLLVGTFVAYWVALMFSFILLPEAWTEAMWAWASGLYAEHMWFKVATIAAFTLLVMPILGFWPGRDPLEEAVHDKKMRDINDAMIAAKQQERALAERRAAQEFGRIQAHKNLFG